MDVGAAAAAPATPWEALQDDPRAVLLRLRGAAARLALRAAARRERRPPRPHDDRPAPAKARAADDRVAPSADDGSRERSGGDRPEEREGARDGGVRTERRTAAVQPRDAGASPSGERVQAVHARGDARARNVAVLVLHRSARADDPRPALSGRLPPALA